MVGKGESIQMKDSQIIKDFLELVQIDSASRDERLIADALKVKLEALGCEVYEDDTGEKIGGNTGNVYAVLDGGLPGAALLSAHMDRVPNGKGIKPVVGDELITSDGTTILASDDLAGVVSILDGMRRLKASGTPFPRVEAIFSVCEEKGVVGSKYFDYNRFTAKNGFVFDSPGRMGRVIQSAPSKCQIKIVVHGKPAHAGNEPEKGIDALKIAAGILAGLKTARIDEETVSNFPMIKTNNSSTNVVCDYAEITGEGRSRNHQKLLDYLAYLEKFCKDSVEGTGATVEVEVVHNYTGFAVPTDSETIQIAGAALKEMGIEMTVNAGGGGMDANRLNANGIVSVGVATGYSKNHTLNEQVYIEDLARAGELVERIVRHCAK